MQLVRLLIATLVLLVLGGAIWWSNKHDPKPEGPESAVQSGVPDTKAKKPAGPIIIAITEPNVKQLDFERKGEPMVTATYAAPAGWSIVAPQTLDADQRTIIGVVAASTNLAAERVVDEKTAGDPAALASYGLNPPLGAVKFTMKDGSTKRIRVGENTPDGTAAYASVDGDTRLFTLPTAMKAYFQQGLRDLREKHFLKFDQDQLTRVELNVTGKPPLEFGKSGDLWQLVKPQAVRADAAQVEELLHQLKGAEIYPNSSAPARAKDDDPKDLEKSINEKAAAAAFASAKPFVIARVTAPDGVRGLEVRKSGDAFYAQGSGPHAVPGAYKIGKELSDALNKTAQDFRNKKLFDFGFNDPVRIEYRYMGSTRAFEKSGEKWLSDAREMDAVAVQNVLDKLRDLAASRVEDGKAAPPASSNAMELTVVSNPAVSAKPGTPKRSEKVVLSPLGAPASKEFVGRRESDKTAYVVDEATVKALTEAVNGVREAETKDKAKK